MTSPSQSVIPRFPLEQIARIDPYFHVFRALLPKDEHERFEWYGSQRYQPRVVRSERNNGDRQPN